jgi:hypothetical protein
MARGPWRFFMAPRRCAAARSCSWAELVRTCDEYISLREKLVRIRQPDERKGLESMSSCHLHEVETSQNRTSRPSGPKSGSFRVARDSGAILAALRGPSQ